MTMALELLRRLASQPLPCTVEQPAEIVLLRALRATGLVQADVPRSLTVGGFPFQRPATARVVTHRGWQALLAAGPPLPCSPRLSGRGEPPTPRPLQRKQLSL